MTLNQTKLETLSTLLRNAYTDLFANDPEYAYVASRTTSESLAKRMAIGFFDGTANLSSSTAAKIACKKIGIKHTYKAIREWLSE